MARVEQQDWQGYMRLGLSCRRQIALVRGVVLRLRFTNTGNDTVEIPFSNEKGTLEQLWLEVYGSSGDRLEPASATMVSASRSRLTVELRPGHPWTYNIRAKYVRGELRFPRAVYRLQFGEVYKLRVNFMGTISNPVFLRDGKVVKSV